MPEIIPGEYLDPDTGRILYYDPYSGGYRNLTRAYARRLQRGYARGESRQVARSHRPSQPGLSERQERALRFEAKYGIPLKDWEKIRPYIRENENWTDRIITIQDVAEIYNAFREGYQDPAYPGMGARDWIINRLKGQTNAVILYSVYNDRSLGNTEYYSRSQVWVSRFDGSMVTAPPIEWWYYH